MYLEHKTVDTAFGFQNSKAFYQTTLFWSFTRSRKIDNYNLKKRFDRVALCLDWPKNHLYHHLVIKSISGRYFLWINVKWGEQMLIWKVVGESLTGGEIHVNSKWDLLPGLGLRCTVFILWDFAAFSVSLGLFAGVLSALCSVRCVFLIPWFGTGKLGPANDDERYVEKAIKQAQDLSPPLTWISPVQWLPHLLGEPPRLCLEMRREVQHVTSTETADSCKMNCSRTENLPEYCSFAAIIVQMVLPPLF